LQLVTWILKIPPHLAYVATLPCETLMSAKQAVNDKLQGSVATYLRCGGVVNNQIKKGLLLSLRVKKIKSAKLQARTCTLSRALSPSFSMCVGQAQKVHETITFLLVTLPNIHRFKNNFTHRLSNKPFLIRLITTPPHLKYVTTLPCNLSLMTCFADNNVLQGSVATYTTYGGILNILLTANLPRNLPVKNS